MQGMDFWLVIWVKNKWPRKHFTVRFHYEKNLSFLCFDCWTCVMFQEFFVLLIFFLLCKIEYDGSCVFNVLFTADSAQFKARIAVSISDPGV